MFNKRFLSRILLLNYFLQLNNEKQTQQQQQKMSKRFQQTCHQDIQITNKYMKRCPTSLVIREMKVKAAMKYHCMPTMMAIKKKEEK